MNSVEEMKELMIKSLENRGVLGQIRVSRDTSVASQFDMCVFTKVVTSAQAVTRRHKFERQFSLL